MPIVPRSSFRPAWWLRNPHMQTLWPALMRRVPSLPRHRERLTTPDDDFLELDWLDRDSGPLVILLHGLSGSSASSYILGMQAALDKSRMDSVALNFRGCSGTPNLTARCYHSGDTGDLDYLYSVLVARFPGRPLCAIGFSLGGNVLLKWLGELGRRANLLGAAAISVPMLLHRCADRMDIGFSRIYRNHLLNELKGYVRVKRTFLQQRGQIAEYQKLASLGKLDDLNSFWEYDDRVVAPLYGFQNVHDYYRRSSSRQFLREVHCPTLIVHARDDPFMDTEVIPAEHELSSSVTLELTQAGGHVGFIAGNSPLRPQYWLEQRIPYFLAQQVA